MSIGAVLLAAGAATRMGAVKQLLPYRGSTLIQHTITQAAEAGFSPLVVVLGANASAIQKVLANASCETVVNTDWFAGMGSSLRAGVTKLLELAPDATGIAALLADQPCIPAGELRAMNEIFETKKYPIVAAEYNGAPGVPAIFERQYFDMLLNLPPEAGARHLLRNAGPSLYRYPLSEAAIDVDTPEDYSGLL